MALYGGFDLHSSNNYLAIIDENDKRILKKKLDNDPDLIISTLKPYKMSLKVSLLNLLSTGTGL